MTSCPEALRILEFEKKKKNTWDSGLDEESRFSELAEANPVVYGGVPHVVEIMSLSTHIEKP